MAAKLIGPNLDLQFFKKFHFLDEVIVFGHLPCKGLKEEWKTKKTTELS